MELPTEIWVKVLLFAGEAGPAATSRAVAEAVPRCLAQLVADPGVAAYVPVVPSLADAFAGVLLFAHDTVLATHFATRRRVVAAYLRSAACPRLTDFAIFLFGRPELQPLIQRSRPRHIGVLSFGTVRQPMGWTVSSATTDAVARDLLCALQGVVRAHKPDFPYLWVQINRAETPRRPFVYPRDAFVISLADGRSYDMAAGVISPSELCEAGTIVSFNVPVAPHEVPVDCHAVLKNAGFVIPMESAS